MKAKIRKAVQADAPQFLRIKDQLPMPKSDNSTNSGGFLLGTDLETYRFYIAEAYCLVAELDGEVIGFGIVLPDQLLRDSEIWQKRHAADWSVDLGKYEPQKLAYFEQLAFLSGHRRTVLVLAYNLVQWVFALGCQTLFATTVNQPVLNLAAIPFIRAVSGIQAGNIDEQYPGIGHINSDIYLVEAQIFAKSASAHALFPFVEKHLFSFV